MGVTKERLERFEANRRRLFGLAYRMLGEASEADDVVQDAYLRWERNARSRRRRGSPRWSPTCA
jgi:DNA-directed RNA polymerase specialized sigma24 family protein